MDISSNIPRNISRSICNNFLKNNTFYYDSFALENKTMITKDNPSNIPRNIHNNFLKNNTFNCDSFALEIKMMITKDIPGNIPNNIHNNFLKNNTFNCDSFALENKTVIHMGKHSLNIHSFLTFFSFKKDIQWISIKHLEWVQKIFLTFNLRFFEGYPSKKWIFLGIFLFI